MAIQIIEENRRPTGAEKFNAAMNTGFEMLNKYNASQQQLQNMKQENEAVKRLTGKDISGITDPKAREKIIPELLKGQKPLNALQEAQKNLADERLKAAQSTNKLFQGLQGEATPQDIGLGEEGEFQQEMPNQGNFDIKNIPIPKLKQIAAFAGQPGQEGILGNIAKAEVERREEEEKTNRKTFLDERGYHTQFSKDAIKEADQLRSSIPKKEMALDFARNAIETGNTKYFSPDKLADVTGLDLFRTAKGAQLVTAGKENLLSNMSRVSARAQNIWFEQRLNSMFPKIGQSDEANLTVQEMIEAEVAMDKAYLEEFDRIADEDEKKFGYERKDIAKRAHQSVKPLQEHILRRSSFRIKEIEEQEKGLTRLKKEVGSNVPRGTPLTPLMLKLYIEKFGKENALKTAEKNGYTIPTFEEYQSYESRPNEFRRNLPNRIGA